MFEDEQTRASYVLMIREQFQRLVYDDFDLSADEMVAAALVCVNLNPESF